MGDDLYKNLGEQLDRIPPGINMQVTVQLEPRDPQPDLEYFIDRAQRWHALANDENLPARARGQAGRISAAAQQMTAFVALWFDRSLPITWRTIYTLFWKAPLQISKHPLFSLRKDGGRNLGHLDFVPEARQALSRTHGIVSAAFREAGLPLRDLTPGEMCQIVWRGLHSLTANLSLVLIGAHVALHWRWIVETIKRYVFRPFLPKRSAAVSLTQEKARS